MLKKVTLCAALLLGFNSLAISTPMSETMGREHASEFMSRKRVVVDTSKAELCFKDDGKCYPVLIGKSTPKGVFPMTLHTTKKKGYGGEVIGFKEEGNFLFALHRVWTLIPAERRMERIASPVVADRIMTNGCINVTNDVYEKLRTYFTLEVI